MDVVDLFVAAAGVGSQSKAGGGGQISPLSSNSSDAFDDDLEESDSSESTQASSIRTESATSYLPADRETGGFSPGITDNSRLSEGTPAANGPTGTDSDAAASVFLSASSPCSGFTAAHLGHLPLPQNTEHSEGGVGASQGTYALFDSSQQDTQDSQETQRSASTVSQSEANGTTERDAGVDVPAAPSEQRPPDS